jgi:hypothetical protein
MRDTVASLCNRYGVYAFTREPASASMQAWSGPVSGGRRDTSGRAEERHAGASARSVRRIAHPSVKSTRRGALVNDAAGSSPPRRLPAAGGEQGDADEAVTNPATTRRGHGIACAPWERALGRTNAACTGVRCRRRRMRRPHGGEAGRGRQDTRSRAPRRPSKRKCRSRASTARRRDKDSMKAPHIVATTRPSMASCMPAFDEKMLGLA